MPRPSRESETAEDRAAGGVLAELAQRLAWACYDLLWLVVLLLSSPWWVIRSIGSRSFRRMVAERLTFSLPQLGPARGQGRVIVHGVSVGEVKAGKSLVAALREEHEVVITASTDSGLAVAKTLYPDLLVVRFPIDFRPVVARLLSRLRPTSVVLLELEIWPRFVKNAARRGIPTAIVSGRITEESFRNYRPFSPTLTQFSAVRLVAAQTETYARRFRALGVREQRLVVTGNIKVDGLALTPEGEGRRTRALAAEIGLLPGQPVLLAGSTHPGEELIAARAFRAAAPEARTILVPRHPPRVPEVLSDLAAEGFSAQRLTALRAGEAPDPGRVLLVDTIGELERLYGLAQLSFVGGTLVPRGGQNVLEPAARGSVVLHGPDLANFQQEALLLAEARAAVLVRDESELEQAVRRLLADAVERARLVEAGRAAVEGQRGATARTLAALRMVGIVGPSRQGSSESSGPADPVS